MKINLDLPDNTKLIFVNCIFEDETRNALLIDGFGFGPSDMKDGNVLTITPPNERVEDKKS